MFVALGTSGDPEQAPEQLIDGFWYGLSKRSSAVA
jgi:4,5-DOPA dioxygenase extradiol